MNLRQWEERGCICCRFYCGSDGHWSRISPRPLSKDWRISPEKLARETYQLAIFCVPHPHEVPCNADKTACVFFTSNCIRKQVTDFRLTILRLWCFLLKAFMLIFQKRNYSPSLVSIAGESPDYRQSDTCVTMLLRREKKSLEHFNEQRDRYAVADNSLGIYSDNFAIDFCSSLECNRLFAGCRKPVSECVNMHF